MLNYMLNAQGGFTPAAVVPPMRQLPNRCYVSSLSIEAVWGDTEPKKSDFLTLLSGELSEFYS
jgi:hypothetical protein